MHDKHISRTFRFGTQDVDRLGYGAMRLSGQPGNFGPYRDPKGGIELVRTAHALGVRFFDSAWAYGPQTVDQLLGEALEGRDAFVATKGGVDKSGPGQIVVDGRPQTLLRQIDQARSNLRRDRIDLFQLHRVDAEVGIERSVEALAEAQARGWIAHIGLSNVTRAQLDQARSVASVASVQNRLNLVEREDEALVDYTASLGIAFIPYGPLGAHPMRPGAELSAQDALAWLLRRADNIVAIPGTTSIAHLRQNWDTWDLVNAEPRKST